MMRKHCSHVFVFIMIFFLFSPLPSTAATPSGFPDKSLLTSNPKVFWQKFGEAVTKATPNLSIKEKGIKIVEAVDAHQSHYQFFANTGYTGRIRYLGGDERCQVWRTRLMEAFTGAGIKKSSIVYSNSHATGLTSYNIFDVNRVHTAPSLIDENGDIFVFDVWQQGYDQSSLGVGSVKGVGKSRYNGMTMADWTALQNKSGRSKIDISDNPLEVFIDSLAGDSVNIIIEKIKAGKCDKPQNIRELGTTVRGYAVNMVNDKWKYSPYYLIREMIKDGKLKCTDFEISNSILLLLDTSGSMSGKKLTDAKNAATATIQSMPLGVEVGIMTYSGGCNKNFSFFPFTRNVEKLSKAIATISAGGGTPMSPALGQAEKAIRAFGHGKTAKIILLCDGQNDCSTNPVKAAERIYRRNIPVSVRNQNLLSYQRTISQLFSSDSAEKQTQFAAETTEEKFLTINFKDILFDEPLNQPMHELQTIRVFTVGLQVNDSQQKALDNVAKSGGGKSVPAQNAKDLVKAFDDAIQDKPQTKQKPKPKPKKKQKQQEDSEGWENIVDDLAI